MLTKHTYSKMNQDLAKTKYPAEVYYEGNNIRIITNSDFGAITNEKGNELILTIPTLVTNPTTKPHLDLIPYPISHSIIGHTTINNTLILLTTSLTTFAVYTVDIDYNIQLVFFDTIAVTTPVDIKVYFENENIQKIYFADGVHELRFMNIADPDLLNLDVNFISVVPNVSLTNPTVTGFASGGLHTSGMIQYAYNLYNFNGSQTKVSATSELVPLNNEDLGNQVNISVSKSPIVYIDEIDQSYEFIRLYSIKYTSLNATPEVKILFDEPITGTDLTFTDDNNSTVQIITFDEFLFLGGEVYIPLHLNIKDNNLFIANYKTKSFDIDFDTRAYSYDINGDAVIVTKDNVLTSFNVAAIPVIPDTHDAINSSIKADVGDADYKLYQYDGTGNLGGKGINVKYNIKYRTVNTNFSTASMNPNPNFATSSTPNQLLSLKSGEVYRIGIEFQNTKGQWSFPKWIADVRIPEINTTNITVNVNGQVKYAYIEVELLNNPVNNTITGWRVCRVERTQSDRTVITQGFINPTIRDEKSPGYTIYPTYLTRTFRNKLHIPNYLDELGSADPISPSQDPREYIYPTRYNTNNDIEGGLSSNDSSLTDYIRFRREILSDDGDYIIDKLYNTFHSPEIVKDKNNLGINIGDKIRFIGLVRNTHSRSSRDIYGSDGLLITERNPSATNMLSSSATETHPGATILAQLSFTPITSEETQRNRLNTYKVISGYNHQDTDNNHLYSRLEYAYVRYFSGFEFVNNDQVINLGVTAPYLGPVEGIRNIDYSGIDIGYNPNSQFITLFGADSLLGYRPATFRQYGGSNVLLRIEDIVAKFPAITNDIHDYLPIIEIYRNNENQYGGNTYTARQRNRYIPFSNLVPITTNVVAADKGDTYIQLFNYLKVFKSDNQRRTITEIVSVPLESSINLDMRFDVTKRRPDNKLADELTSYGFNDVYNQKDNAIPNISKPANFQELNKFPLDVLPSKKKFSGEIIDSFTDFLPNDKISMEGRYGPVTALVETNDNLFTFQRNAIAYLAINPRVQIQASDGIPIELGTGRLIERYQYVSTNSGSVNKHSIVKTNNGLIYYDLLGKSINFFGQSTQKVSTLNGLYNKVKDFTEQYSTDLVIDNPLTYQGVLSHYNPNEEDTYITFLTPNNRFTVVYNGLNQGFVSYYDYKPNMYINLDNKVITGVNGFQLWEHGIGEYQTYYDQYYPMSIEIITNEHGDVPKIFNNIHFNSYVSVNNQDQPNVTFNKMQIYNDYQNTGIQDILIDNRNAAKRHRRFNIIIPRQSGTRNRILNNWTNIKLEFNKTLTDDPSLDYKVVLHDILVSYSIAQ